MLKYLRENHDVIIIFETFGLSEMLIKAGKQKMKAAVLALHYPAILQNKTLCAVQLSFHYSSGTARRGNEVC